MLQALKLDLKFIYLFQKVLWIYLGNTIIFDIYLMEIFEYSKIYSMKNIRIVEYIQRGQNVSNEYLNIFTNLKWSNIFGTEYIRLKIFEYSNIRIYSSHSAPVNTKYKSNTI